MLPELPHRFPWSTTLSVVLHGAVITGLFYLSINHVVEMPSQAPELPVSITMVSPTDLAQPQAVQPASPPEPEPVVQPEPEPVVQQEPEPVQEPEPPKAAEVVVPKPQPKPRPKPKPEPKPKPRPEKKAEPRKPVVKPAEQKPAMTQSQAAAQSAPLAAAPPTHTPAAPSDTASSGPKPLSRSHPDYPPRALTLRIEGKVQVKFDVDSDGQVVNLQIVSAQPANMFEREVKRAARKWRYESGKPATGLTVNIVFRVDGGASMN